MDTTAKAPRRPSRLLDLLLVTLFVTGLAVVATALGVVALPDGVAARLPEPLVLMLPSDPPAAPAGDGPFTDADGRTHVAGRDRLVTGTLVAQQPANAAQAAAFAPTGADVDAAVDVAGRDDDGAWNGLRRFDTATVTVSLAGNRADAAHAEVVEVLAWLSDVTGRTWQLVDEPGAQVRVIAAAGVAPTATVRRFAGSPTINSVDVSFDPRKRRWIWEELLHAAGPQGDHAGGRWSVHTTAQTHQVAGPFDRWLLGRLYAAEVLPQDPAGARAVFAP